MCLLLIAVLFVAALLARSIVAERIAISELARRLGADVSADSVTLHTDGVLIVEELSVRAPGLPGRAGELLHAERVEVLLDRASLFRGKAVIRSVVLTRPVARVSEHETTGAFNVDALARPQAGDSSAGAPAVTVVDGRLEMGRHGDTGYTRLARVRVDGSVLRRPGPAGDPGVYDLTLEQTPAQGDGLLPAGLPEVVSLSGVLDREGPSLQVTSGPVTLGAVDPSQLMPTLGELFEALEPTGRIERVVVSYDPVSRLTLDATVSDASLRPPAPAARPDLADGARLSLTHVSGNIVFHQDGPDAGLHADLTGLVEDLPCEVNLAATGPDLDTAPIACVITAQDFVISKNPVLLDYAPPWVNEQFEMFSGPTALVDARVLLTRPAADPATGEPGAFSASGSLVFENGAAAFDEFPYPFTDMGGQVDFSGQEVRIVSIRGRGETGAVLNATGTVSPPTREAGVDLTVMVLDVPVDHVLESAMPGGRADVLEALFNEEAAARLEEAGLIASPGSRARAEAELESATREITRLEQLAPPPATDIAAQRGRAERARRVLDAPEFGVGGLARVSIHVTREARRHAPVEYEIIITMPRAGFLPKAFPAPLIGRDVQVRVGERSAELIGGSFRGLGGGDIDLGVRIALRDEDNKPAARAEIDVAGDEFPLDQLLIQAIPDGEGGSWAKNVLSALNVRGQAEFEARARPADASGDALSLHVEAAMRDGRFSPREADGSAGAFELRDVEGRLVVSDGAVRLEDFVGEFGALGEDGGAPVRFGAGYERVDDRDELRAWVEADAIDLAAPIEPLIALLAPGADTPLRDLREQRSPSGPVDARVDATSVGGELNVRAGIAPRGAIGFDTELGRVVAHDAAGRITVALGSERFLVLDGCWADLTLDGEALGSATLGGRLERNADQPLVGRLDLGLSGARFESRMTRGVLGDRPAITQLDPEGVFDADIRLEARPVDETPRGDGVVADDTGAGTGFVRASEWLDLTLLRAADAEIRPRWLELTLGGGDAWTRRVRFDEINGSATARPDEDGGFSGQLDRLELRGEALTLEADGGWGVDERGVMFSGELEGRAEGLTPEVMAALPDAVREAVLALEVRVAGPIRLAPSRLHIARGESESRGSVTFDGALELEGASLVAGVDVQDAFGRVSVFAEQLPGMPEPSVDIEALLDVARVAGLIVSDVRARVTSGSAPGSLVAPLITASCYGGRVSAEALVGGTSESDGARSYRVQALLSGARMAPVLADLRGSLDAPPLGPPNPNDSEFAGDDSRGVVEAALSMQGVVGDPASRRGRGWARVSGGDVVRLPLVVPLVQLSNLQAPSGDSLDYLQAECFVEGDTVRFEHIAILSRTLSIVGGGVLDWPSMTLDLAFNSRAGAARRLPIVAALVETVRDQIVTTRVTGPVSDPEIGLESFGGAWRVVSGILGGEGGVRNAAWRAREARARYEERRAVAGGR